ncbi:transcriptional regulator (plasmid) [Ketogulonicigenium robustum]|uniref:Transcriptional regulator n=1 Tax=Ketogulonicigenium robustum TaxID=92947 RepID=A0A1W6P3T5_9RHOB|nr:TetR/AcrR family transcriptional regulator [Ketogulonicigenium robustum]ARO16010.1 transcriptional regulator [Ketogulonicigenium robustum]
MRDESQPAPAAAAPKAAQRRAPKRQVEKSEAMIAALLKATQDLLLEVGYSRLTTTMIAQRAQVSRGAMTHHFRSKEHLITTAIDRHLHEVNEQLFAFANDMDRHVDADATVDYLWAMMSDGLFYLTLEYLPEARHNEDFRLQVVPVVKEFHAGLEAIWDALAKRYNVDPAYGAVLMNLTMCLIRGMIAQTIVRYDKSYFEAMLSEWKSLLKTQLRTAPTPPIGSPQ